MIPCIHFSWADYHVFTHPLPKLMLTVQAGTEWGWVFRSLGVPGGSRGHPWARCLSGAACAFWRGPRFSEYDPCSCTNRVRVLCSQPLSQTAHDSAQDGVRETGLLYTGLHGWGRWATLSVSHALNFSAPEKSWDEKALGAELGCLGRGKMSESQTVPLTRSKSANLDFFFFFLALVMCWNFSGGLLDMYKISVISEWLSIKCLQRLLGQPKSWSQFISQLESELRRRSAHPLPYIGLCEMPPRIRRVWSGPQSSQRPVCPWWSPNYYW